jgi:hypothetical protein
MLTNVPIFLKKTFPSPSCEGCPVNFEVSGTRKSLLKKFIIKKDRISDDWTHQIFKLDY